MQIFVKDRDFYKTLAGLALPIAAQQLISVGVNMADNMMLGQLGEIPMSAATLANNFIMNFTIMCMGMGMGASVLVSRFFGMGDGINMKKSVNIMFRMLFVIALAFSLVTGFFPSQIMAVFSTDKEVIAQGTGYLLICLPCYFLNGAALTTSLILRSVGKATIPLIASVFSFFINIFGNWILIFGHFGLPAMGANGAATSTLLARILEFVVIMGYFFFKDENIRMRFRDLTMSVGDLVPEYIRIALPVLISDTLLGVGNTALAIIMGHIGPVFVAANAITTVTMSLVTVVIQGISQASCTITGITLGRGEYEKARQQGITFAALGFIIGAIGCVLIIILKKPIISYYNIMEETRVLADRLMLGIAIIVLFKSANNILTKGTLRGGGDTRFLMVFDIIFLWIFSIPLGAFAGLVWHWPGFWILIMLRIDEILKCFVCVWRLLSGKWIKVIKGS